MSAELFQPRISPEIASRFPDYRALSVVVRGFRPENETKARHPVLPAWAAAHIDSWHQAFRQFGSNPKKTAPSADALIKRFRKDGFLPAISPVVDCYNALSVQFAAPFGGEDVDRYVGLPSLEIATGTETFDTARDGQPVVETVDPGEVIWRDEAGVTCRRWNWRQCKRTAIRDDSTNLWFIIDRLQPFPLDDLQRAGQLLCDGLQEMSPSCTYSITLIG